MMERGFSTRSPAEVETRDEERVLPGTILVLTGDLAAQDHLTELALEQGYGLCCRAVGQEAMRILAAEPPQVLVVHLEAPGARELMRTVRAHATWREIPLLALTATNNAMIGVTVDAPIFFMPELTGLEQALAARLTVASS
jgi:CheY-like chemotaxis protein